MLINTELMVMAFFPLSIYIWFNTIFTIPSRTNATIRSQQMIQIQPFAGLNSQRFTAITELFICLGYRGNSASKIPIKSTVPNNTSHILWIFDLFSFSAIDTKASADRSSSIEMEKKPAIAFNESILGYPLPFSQLEIVCLETLRSSATCSCVSFL